MTPCVRSRIASGQVGLRRRPQPGAARPAGRAGLTLIEILVVMLIISVLIVGAVLGFRAIERSGRVKETRTVLANGEAMLRELAALNATSRLQSDIVDVSMLPPPTPPFHPQTNGDDGDPGMELSLIDDLNGGDNSVFKSDKILEFSFGTTNPQGTQAVLKVLKTNPKIKQMLDGMPASAMLNPQLVQYADGSAVPAGAPVMMDAWETPIILVPRNGIKIPGTAISGSNAAPGSTLTVTSSGTPTKLTTPNPNRSNRMFWMSAGPDGDFGIKPGSADDNLYSFEP